MAETRAVAHDRGAYVRDLGLPDGALVTMIVRADRDIPPRGPSVLQPGDHLSILILDESLPELRQLFETWRATSHER